MLAALLAAALVSVHAPGPAGDGAPQMLVQVTPAAACSHAAPLLRAGGTLVAAELRLYRLPADSAAVLAPRLRRAGALQTIVADRRAGRLTAIRSTEPLAAEEWWRVLVGIDGLTPPGPGKPVTVVDSGIDLRHPEFAGRPNLTALNAQEPAPIGGVHGTSVASLVGAPVNGLGIAGIYPEAVLYSWDGANGEGRELLTSEIVSGVLAASRVGPGVVNLSLGGDRDPVLEQAIAVAWARGSLVVAASGNDGLRGSPLGYPAALPHVLTVAATDRTGAVAGFSSASRFVDLAAPGAGITVASAPTGGWTQSSGTSFSAPLTAGAAAWVWTVRPELDHTQLFEVMRRSARDIDVPGRDVRSGFGALDVSRALTWPAPARDPFEPNEDVEYVKPGGYFSTGRPPLSTKARPAAGVSARLDAAEDPRDVYRVWIPAGRRLAVTLRGAADVDLSVWSAGTISADQGPGPARLASSARRGRPAESVVVPARKTGRWAYVAVVPGRGVADTSYTLAVRPR